MPITMSGRKSHTFNKQQLLPLTELRKDSLLVFALIISHERDAMKHAVDFVVSKTLDLSLYLKRNNQRNCSVTTEESSIQDTMYYATK